MGIQMYVTSLESKEYNVTELFVFNVRMSLLLPGLLMEDTCVQAVLINS